MMATPREIDARARAVLQQGDVEEAIRILREGVSTHKESGELWNALGNVLLKANDTAAAAGAFASAYAKAPARVDFAINQAIALNRLENFAQARRVLEAIEHTGAQDRRYASTRASAERGNGNLETARQWYERALANNPESVIAAHGRARVALEMGEDDAAERFRKAAALQQGNREILLGLAEALEAEGDHALATAIGEKLAELHPAWTDGLDFLAQVRLARGPGDFAEVYRKAHRQAPQSREIVLAWYQQLSATDRYAEAADVARDGAQSLGEGTGFTYLEAIAASAAGDLDRAEALFSRQELSSVEQRQHLARHRLRQGDIEAASRTLSRNVKEDPSHFSSWALLGIVWRLNGDERAEWLHGQEGLVRLMELPLAAQDLVDIEECLDRLHERAAFPLGQSLRGGTQTRGRIFNRTEEPIRRLKVAIEEVVESYRSQLPKADESHPILSRVDDPLVLDGSWSVRFLEGAGHHAPHIHPRGLLSSAGYIRVPTQASGGELELGRPPADLGLDLEPVETLVPQRGHIALFPSTLYHGTRPFSGGSRMSVAFDIIQGQVSR